MRYMHHALTTVAFLVWASISLADVTPHVLFADHMVLQQNASAPVWGTAADGEKVTVTLGDASATTNADSDGKWMVRLNTGSADGHAKTLTIKGKNTIVLKDVLLGEVWIGSGQSNMQWPVERAANPAQEIPAANYPNIRLFTVPRVTAGQPQPSVDGKWQACTPEIVPSFSAVLYYFGRQLHRDLDVPMGLIHTSWGGTPAESWTRREVLEANPILKGLVTRWDHQVANQPQRLAKYLKRCEKWIADADAAEAAGKPMPQPLPQWPKHDPRLSGHRPTGLYNAMIHPLIPFAIKGSIWYQGESNAGRAWQYRTLFPAMITCWREDWGQGDFPFFFVQLANFRARQAEPGDNDWAELREAQLKTLDLPNTGMAVIIDIGEANDIHPKNKQDVGKRLALAARAKAYGERIVYSGPIYKSMKTDGNKVRLSFDHVGGGLVAKDDKLPGFSIAGADRKFVWAEARIEGDAVVVSSDAVAKPVAVRYAWAINPVCSLYNAEGLPASPFRTDDFPMVTKPKE